MRWAKDYNNGGCESTLVMVRRRMNDDEVDGGGGDVMSWTWH